MISLKDIIEKAQKESKNVCINFTKNDIYLIEKLKKLLISCSIKEHDNNVLFDYHDLIFISVQYDISYHVWSYGESRKDDSRFYHIYDINNIVISDTENLINNLNTLEKYLE